MKICTSSTGKDVFYSFGPQPYNFASVICIKIMVLWIILIILVKRKLPQQIHFWLLQLIIFKIIFLFFEIFIFIQYILIILGLIFCTCSRLRTFGFASLLFILMMTTLDKIYKVLGLGANYWKAIALNSCTIKC